MASVAATGQGTSWYRNPHIVTFLAMAALLASALPIRTAVQSGIIGRKLKEELPKARAAGVPLQASDVYRPAPVRLNAAPLLMSAFAQLRKAKADDWIALEGDPRNPKRSLRTSLITPAAKAVLARGEPVLDQLKRAVSRPYCDFGRNPNLGLNELFPSLGPAKDLCRLATDSAYAHAMAGEHARAVDDLAAASSLARLTAQGNTTIAALVAVACDSMVLVAVERCMAETHNEAQVALYTNLVDRSELKIDLLPIAKSEAYSQLLAAKNAHLFKKTGDEMVSWEATGPMDPSEMPKQPRDRKVFASVLKMWSPVFEQISSAHGDPSAVRSALEAFDDSHRKAMAQAEISGDIREMFGPSFFVGLYRALDRDTAQYRCTRVALNVMATKARTGAFPWTSDQIPGLLKDPFDGQNLRYRRTSDGFRVYSVGEDKTDDRGLRRSEQKSNWTSTSLQSYDVATSYPPLGSTPRE